MKLSSRKVSHERKLELSMTSMIDVVFLLLIFFIMTASFVKTERNLNSSITVKRKSASTSSSDLEPAIVQVVHNGDAFVYRVGARDIQDEVELFEVMRQFENKLDGAFVRVSDRAPFGMAATAIQACKSGGFAAVSYVPLEGDVSP